VRCPTLTDPNNGMINCSLGDDGVPSYEDTCSFTCNTGYELTGSDTRTCQSNGNWSDTNTTCRRGDIFTDDVDSLYTVYSKSVIVACTIVTTCIL